MGFSNERMRTGQLVNFALLAGMELTEQGNPVTRSLALPFGVDHLIGFNELLTCRHPENAGVHFFLDDYQFERFWRQPQRYLSALAQFPLVIGPDFSLYTDFPEPLQRWNHYRNQLLTAWHTGADPAGSPHRASDLRQNTAGAGGDPASERHPVAELPAWDGCPDRQRGGALMGGRGSSMRGSQGMGAARWQQKRRKERTGRLGFRQP